jgi:acetoacetyl-[acyl-carrier protein] synthase
MPSTRLPLIVGFGGFNAAGRTSFHHGYRRTVLESLPKAVADETVVGLATLTDMVKYKDGQYQSQDGKIHTEAEVARLYREAVEKSTLVRRIESNHFDVDAAHWHKQLDMQVEAGSAPSFLVSRKQLPEPIPNTWHCEDMEDGHVRVRFQDSLSVKVDSYREFPVQSAGQLPTGFDPSRHYASRFHPRGLQMTVVGASDALHSVGIDWQTIVNAVRPDEIGVVAGSVLSQMDEDSNRGLLQIRLNGGRATSKQVAFGMNTMPADFINAYILGSVGSTGHMVGACATFLYALRQGVEDIQSGRRRVVLVGSAEAPITPEIIEGFDAMSALARDSNLCKLDGVDQADHRRASRPFGENCGFVMSEAAQFVLLMDDALALELGATIYGAVPHVFVNADGYKKSISAPGPGNYITLAKTLAATRAILGEESIRHRSIIQAHGSSTPQNRVTESLILDRVAQAFGIEQWPLAAIKAYVGHTIGPASADQLACSLGVFHHGWLPGIKTINEVADDVHDQRLSISNRDRDLSDNLPEVAFLNSKGFGGNNASAAVLAPQVVEKMLRKRHGDKSYRQYQGRNEAVTEVAEQYNQRALRGELGSIYKFGENMIDEKQIELDGQQLTVPGFSHRIPLNPDNPFDDMV